MRLEVDLAFDAVPDAQPPDSETRALDLHTIAGAVRSPARLRDLLRAERYDELRVHTGTLPLSALQAIVMLALCGVRTSEVVVDGRPVGRGTFLTRALSTAARAAAGEAWRTVENAVRIVRGARRTYRLPRHVQRPGSALYLRVEPSLRWLGSQVGGAATHTSGVVNGLLDNGVDVRVFAAERPLGTERANFVAVPPKRILHLVRGVGYTDYSHTVAQAAFGYRADFVYQRYQMGSFAGLDVARRLRVPLVLEFNGPEVWVERHWRSGRLLLGGPLERLEQRNLRDASLVVVVSEPLRRHVLEQGVAPERVLVNPNGVDVEELAPYRTLPAIRWRERLGVPDRPTVGFIGTFGLWHGVKLLPDLIDAVPEAQWLLVGGGGLVSEVRAEVEMRGLADRVTFTGVLERARALEMLSCCDVCVSPHVANPDGSSFFGSPTKLFEYMGLRRAIVASDLDQIGEVIEHGVSGLLCAPGDAQAAASAVRRLLADETLRDRLAGGALARARERYSWDAHVRRTLAALTGTQSANVGDPVASVTA